MYVLLGISIVVLWAVGPIAVVVMADRHREQLRLLREQLCPHCRQKVDKLGGAADGSGAAQVGVWGAMERKVRLATAVSGVSERPELAPSDRFRYGERVASQQVDVLVAER